MSWKSWWKGNPDDRIVRAILKGSWEAADHSEVTIGPYPTVKVTLRNGNIVYLKYEAGAKMCVSTTADVWVHLSNSQLYWTSLVHAYLDFRDGWVHKDERRIANKERSKILETIKEKP